MQTSNQQTRRPAECRLADTYRALETLHWCPERTVADIKQKLWHDPHVCRHMSVYLYWPADSIPTRVVYPDQDTNYCPDTRIHSEDFDSFLSRIPGIRVRVLLVFKVFHSKQECKIYIYMYIVYTYIPSTAKTNRPSTRRPATPCTTTPSTRIPPTPLT